MLRCESNECGAGDFMCPTVVSHVHNGQGVHIRGYHLEPKEPNSGSLGLKTHN